MLIATDHEVRAVPAAEAVSLMWDAVAAHGSGDLCAPARTTIELGAAAMTLTAGRLPGTASGFRMYSTAPEAQEVTLVFRASGDPLGLITGSDLGRRRTGALGGVAAKLCARRDARTVGLVGAGSQAFTQLWAIAAVRDIERANVYSRAPDTARKFAVRAGAELGIDVDVQPSARAAVAGADIVVLATPAAQPLVDVSWIAPGTHVHTLGPKGVAEGECPKSLVRTATILTSDSPIQLLAMEGSDQPWTGGRTPTPLGDILTGRQTGRRHDDDITLYASVGLSGTEVLFAHHVLTCSEA